MSAAELKAYIDKVLGNSIRCLLPSYWWKRLFGLVVDKVAEIEGNVSDVKINKVDKVSGKGLSTNDYTAAEKNKLAGIAANAEVNVQSDWSVTDSSSDAFIKNKPTIPAAVNVDSSISDTSTNPVQNKIVKAYVDEAVSGKVDKINGKGLSTNDYTTAEKNKLAGIAANAEVNVQSDWNATSGDALILNKPSIPTETTVANWGFTKNTGTYSKPSSGIPKSDLASEVQTSLAKADAAVQKVKTINGESIIGDGNIDIKAGSDIDVTSLATKADLEEAEEVHAAALNALHVRILALESAIGNR